MLAPYTLTFGGKNYRKGTPLPDQVAAELGLAGAGASPDASESLSFEAEARAAVLAVAERRAAAGDADAIDALEQFRAEAAASDDFADDESGFADDFPGRAALVKLGLTPADVDALDREGLVALDGIGEKTADAILAARSAAPTRTEA